MINPLTPPSAPNKGQRVCWSNLPFGASVLTWVQLAKQHTGPVVVITQDTQTALRVLRELKRPAAEIQLPVLAFPDWETLPYDHFSPHQDIISQRLATLYQFKNWRHGILVISIQTLMHKTTPQQFVLQHSLVLKQNDTLPITSFKETLVHNGYQLVSQVVAPGECAIRGSIIDLFPMGTDKPIRIDLFDNEIESLRYFDIETQRSLNTLTSINLLPAKEYPLDDKGIETFRKQWRAYFEGEALKSPVYQSISKGISLSGMEYYLPLFFESLSTIFDFLPPDTTLVRYPGLHDFAEQFFKEIESRYEMAGFDKVRPPLAPDSLFLRTDTVFGEMKSFGIIDYKEQEEAGSVIFASMPLSLSKQSSQPLQTVHSLREQGLRVLLTAETLGRKTVLEELCLRQHITPTSAASLREFLASTSVFGITLAEFDEGFILSSQKVAIIPENALLGQTVLQRRRRKRPAISDQAIMHIAELQTGDPVVHLTHGVGRYQGLVHLTLGGMPNECILIEYAGQDKLYVPVTNINVLSRYAGSNVEHAPLHKLGGDTWEKAKRKAMESTRDIAAELLEIYAKRAAKPGFACNPPGEGYHQFAAHFRFEPTPDQERAIEEVLQDMQSPRPMDRLICGDVGFGKTEVAMRAAYLAVENKKQVAILVPTTLLAQQHFESFKDRFAETPVTIEMISRFKSAKEQKAILEKAQTGSIDILIGTHKLLSSELKFQNLGLIVIDEEHRFGVEHKEKLKKLREHVDMLTLTATPIPRTLHMALASIRDLSIIATPPLKRLAIKTFVRRYQKEVIREAILRELMRGGQVYYVHNSVQTIGLTVNTLENLLPEAKITFAHGQMGERQLERIMSDFYHQRSNVLVCTTIIETGIDIPTANTMIIDRADMFGLAQLHQLRGRVGRSHHQAYAYLLTPSEAKITPDAEKRLEAIAHHEELGSGFMLANQDLEIRGAGELLGDAQSGNVEAIGFTLYMELLERTVAAIQQNKTLTDMALPDTTDVNLNMPSFIPEPYLPDVHSRLVLYKRISNVKDKTQFDDLKAEMIDRFGPLPEAALNLFTVAEIKLLASALGIKKLEAYQEAIKIEFHQHTKVSPHKIIQLVQSDSKVYQFQAPNVLRYKGKLQVETERVKVVRLLLQSLGS